MRARIVPITLDDQGLAHIDDAARALVRGELVAFPTETVYGIGANAYHQDAMARLRAVKSRPPDKPFSIHIGRKADVQRHVHHVPADAEKLMRRYWPGPLTIVFPGRDDQGVGIRMPSNRVAIELLKRTAVPIVAPSANRAGATPAKSADEVAATLGDDLDLILDGGTTTLKEASTVVRVGDDGWQILRRGSVTEEMIRRTLGTTIIFVCTANSCRSPMAEVICKELLAERIGCAMDQLEAHGYTVLSAGTSTLWDGPASHQAVEAMRRRGLDLSEHHSRPITVGLIEDADVIFVMARHHGESIARVVPEARAKVRPVGPSGSDVSDPVGGSVQVFVDCARTIERGIRAALESL